MDKSKISQKKTEIEKSEPYPEDTVRLALINTNIITRKAIAFPYCLLSGQ